MTGVLAAQVTVHTGPKALAELEAPWRELYLRARQAEAGTQTGAMPFLSPEWTAACWAECARDRDPYLLALWEEHRLVGLAPLGRRRVGPFRVLSFLADGRSDYLGFLVEPGHPERERALLDALAERRAGWDLAVLRQLTTDFTGLHRGDAPRGLGDRGIEGTVAPTLRLTGSWETLLKEGPSGVRRSARLARRFAREGGAVERHVGGAAAALVEEVSAVEARSWKGREGVARFAPGPGQRLLCRALAELGARGEMELWIARVEGRAAAFQVNFVLPDRLCYYQGAYDESAARLAPGMVLHHHCLRRACEQGLSEYDLMSGDEPYKRDWSTDVRSLRYRALYPDNARGRLAFGLLVAPRWYLKGSPRAHAALRAWHRWRQDPAAAFRALRQPAPGAATPAAAAETG